MDLNMGWPSRDSDALSLDGAPGTVGRATKITARKDTVPFPWNIFIARKKTIIFTISVTWNWDYFSDTNPERLYVSSLPPIRIVQREDGSVRGRGHWAWVRPQTSPQAVVSACGTPDGQNVSHRTSGQLCKALSQEEIPSSLQLVNSYALEPRTDMPCNFLTQLV